MVSNLAIGARNTGNVSSRVGLEWVKNGFMYLGANFHELHKKKGIFDSETHFESKLPQTLARTAFSLFWGVPPGVVAPGSPLSGSCSSDKDSKM